MDLGAYINTPAFGSYVKKHYGDVPRIRGIRLMKLESPYDPEDSQDEMFNKHCGEDVIYVHTRCGAYGQDDNPDCSYVACGGKAWEESNPETFIESIDDSCDSTYRDHYFKAVIDDEYRQLLEAEKGDTNE